jgi:hypothetical protein
MARELSITQPSWTNSNQRNLRERSPTYVLLALMLRSWVRFRKQRENRTQLLNISFRGSEGTQVVKDHLSTASDEADWA